jgi:hypothetical protein
MWNDDTFGKQSKKKEELDETVTTNAAKETTSRSGDDAKTSLSKSPPFGVRRSARLHHSVAQSPAVTP